MKIHKLIIKFFALDSCLQIATVKQNLEKLPQTFSNGVPELPAHHAVGMFVSITLEESLH